MCRSCVWGRFSVLILAVLMVLAPPPASLVGRTWIDKTGQHKVDADLVAVKNGQVQLRRRDGRLFSVAVTKLSDADRLFLAGVVRGGENLAPKTPQDPVAETYAELVAASKRYRQATDVLTAHQRFIAESKAPASDKDKARAVLTKWKELAGTRANRLGNDWHTAAEIEAINAEEFRLIREAHRMMDVKNDELARERFEEASKINPESIRADYYLGLLNALKAKSPLDAQKHFNECLHRVENEPDRLVGTRLANYAAVLNNLAIAEVRIRKFDKAIRHWQEALELSPQTPELVQNLGLLTKVAAGYTAASIPRYVSRKAGDLYGKASVANNSAEFDDSVGWLYMPFIDDIDGTMGSGEDGELRAVSHATCFAVAPDLLVTTTRVLADADKVRVIRGTGNVAPPQEGKLVAFDPESNLAIVRMEGLNAKPLTWRTELPKVAHDYAMIGYCKPGSGATGLRSVETTVLIDPFVASFEVKNAYLWTGNLLLEVGAQRIDYRTRFIYQIGRAHV